jgi:hypothetical protein
MKSWHMALLYTLPGENKFSGMGVSIGLVTLTSFHLNTSFILTKTTQSVSYYVLSLEGDSLHVRDDKHKDLMFHAILSHNLDKLTLITLR